MADAQMDFIDAAKHLTRTTKFRSTFCQQVDPTELLPELNLAQQHVEEVTNITLQRSKNAGCQKLWEFLHREPGWPQDLANALRRVNRHRNLLQILETALPHHCGQTVQGHRVPPRRHRNRRARGGGPPPPGGAGGSWTPPDGRAGGGWVPPDGRAGGGWVPPDGRAGGGWAPPDGRAGGGWAPPLGSQAWVAGPGIGQGWGPLPDQGAPGSQPAWSLPTPTGAQPQQPLPDPRLPVEEERGAFRGVEEEEEDPSGEKVLPGGRASHPQQPDPDFPYQESKLGDNDDDDDADGDDDDDGEEEEEEDDDYKKKKENKEGAKDGRDEDKDEDEAEGGDAIRKGELMKQLAAAYNTDLPADSGQSPPSASATSSLGDTVQAAFHSKGNDTVVLHDDEDEEEAEEEEKEKEEDAINVTGPGDDESDADRAPSPASTIDLHQHRPREADLESNASLASNAPSESTIDLGEVRQRNQPPEPPSTIELHRASPRGPAPAPDSIPGSTYSGVSIPVRDAPACFQPSSFSGSEPGVGPVSSAGSTYSGVSIPVRDAPACFQPSSFSGSEPGVGPVSSALAASAAPSVSSPAQSAGSNLGSLGASSGAGSLPQSIRLHPDRASNHTGVPPRPREDASSAGSTPSLLSRLASSITNIFFDTDG